MRRRRKPSTARMCSLRCAMRFAALRGRGGRAQRRERQREARGEQRGGQQHFDQGEAALRLRCAGRGRRAHCGAALAGSASPARSDCSCRRWRGPPSPQSTSQRRLEQRGAPGSTVALARRVRVAPRRDVQRPAIAPVLEVAVARARAQRLRRRPTCASSDCACSAARPASSAQRTCRAALDSVPSSSVSAEREEREGDDDFDQRVAARARLRTRVAAQRVMAAHLAAARPALRRSARPRRCSTPLLRR